MIIFIFCAIHFNTNAQYKVIAVGFYNCENFFDTINDPQKKDDDFTPGGEYHNTETVYMEKLHNIATVLSQLGTDVTPDGAAIVGFAEIENDNVIKDLITQPEIAGRHYKYEWYHTPDERGISTAMIYNPKYLEVLGSRPVHVPLESLGQRRPTRDVLYVCGILAGDTVHILVNHWPSKSGGEAASAPGRRLAATVNKNISDSILAVNPYSKILIMGDLNDNPTSESVTKVLKAKSDTADMLLTDVYNPWINMYKKGMGTENYKGEWNLIDQVMVSGSFIRNPNNKWRYYNAAIFAKDFMINKIGKDKGLPHRSYSIAHKWDNGFSDHFPVLIYLVQKK